MAITAARKNFWNRAGIVPVVEVLETFGSKHHSILLQLFMYCQPKEVMFSVQYLVHSTQAMSVNGGG